MNNQNTTFPKGDKASADYFTGTAWVKMLVKDDDTFHCSIGNVTFEPEARNNWHTHPGGQILIVTDGTSCLRRVTCFSDSADKLILINIPTSIIFTNERKKITNR